MLDDPEIPPAGPHGGDAAAVAAALGVPRSSLVDLSASLNPAAPDVRPVVAAAIDRLRDYPAAVRPTAALAEALGVEPARLVVTNGGAEAIALVARLVPVGDVVDPEFSLYRRHLDRVEPGAPRWRSNPSNPLGRLAEAHETALVWDEAFFPLATGRWTASAPTDDTDGVWRLGSLTKLWACPGLRLGYAIAPSDADTAGLRRLQPQRSVNALALAAIEPMLARTDLGGWLTEMTRLRRAAHDAITSAGFDVTETDANWLLVRHDTASQLRSLLARGGVVVRACGSFGLADICRVAVPRADEIDRVAAAFRHAAREMS